MRRSWRLCRSSGARGTQESFQTRFQCFDRLLLARKLLREVFQLGLAGGVACGIGFRVDVILFQSEFTLEKV